MNLRLVLPLLAAVSTLFSGCAFVDNTVRFDYQPQTLSPLSDLPKVAIAVVGHDDREQRDRIGNVTNGFNQVTAKVVSDRPIETVIAEAIAEEFRYNGFTVVEPDAAEAVVVIWVKRSDSTAQPNFWDVALTADLQGNVGAGSDLEAASANATVVVAATARRSVQIASESARTEVYNEALADFVRGFTMDPAVLQLLREIIAQRDPT